MDFIEVTGKTVEDAITEACRKLTVTSDHLEYEVIDKGNTGFLGFNSKPAIIKARAKVEIVEDEEVFVKPEVSLYASDEKKESVKPVS